MAAAARGSLRNPMRPLSHGLEMPWVLSGCRNSSNLTNEEIYSKNTRYGNSRTGSRNREPEGQDCKADSAWDRCAPEQLPGGAQDRCRWDPAGAKLQG